MTKYVHLDRNIDLQESNASNVFSSSSKPPASMSKEPKGIVLYEEYRLIERGEAQINVTWRGAHILLFFLAFIFGSFCTFCFHMLMYMFDDKCVLFPKLLSVKSQRHNKMYEIMPIKDKNNTLLLEFVNAQWMDHSVCYLPVYVPLVSGIFGLVWITMFIMCSTGTRTHAGLQSPWRVLIPVFLFSVAMSVLSVHASSVTQSGLQAFCDTLSEITNGHPCSYAVNVVSLAYHRRIRGVYQATRLTILSAWFHTLCWLCSVGLVVLRVSLAVDFQLVRVRAELIGDIDLMLQRNERHVRTISPESEVPKTKNSTTADASSDQPPVSGLSEQQSSNDNKPKRDQDVISKMTLKERKTQKLRPATALTDLQTISRIYSRDARTVISEMSTKKHDQLQDEQRRTDTSHNEEKPTESNTVVHNLSSLQPISKLKSNSGIIESIEQTPTKQAIKDNFVAANNSSNAINKESTKFTPIFINSPTPSRSESIDSITTKRKVINDSAHQSAAKNNETGPQKSVTERKVLKKPEIDDYVFIPQKSKPGDNAPKKEISDDEKITPQTHLPKPESIATSKQINVSKHIVAHRPSVDITHLKEIMDHEESRQSKETLFRPRSSLIITESLSNQRPTEIKKGDQTTKELSFGPENVDEARRSKEPTTESRSSRSDKDNNAIISKNQMTRSHSPLSDKGVLLSRPSEHKNDFEANRLKETLASHFSTRNAEDAETSQPKEPEKIGEISRSKDPLKTPRSPESEKYAEVSRLKEPIIESKKNDELDLSKETPARPVSSRSDKDQGPHNEREKAEEI